MVPSYMRRREFTWLVGTLAAWPLTARAQQQAWPVVAYFSTGNSVAGREKLLDGLRQGLAETAFIESKNLSVAFHWAGDDYGELGLRASELVRQQPAVIVCPQ